MHKHTHLLLSYCQATNQLFNISLKLPAWLWMCRAQLAALLSAAHTPPLMQDDSLHTKENTIFFMSVFNQWSVINVWLLAPLPAVAVSGVSFFMPCVSLTLAARCWVYSCDAAMCAEFGEIFRVPFGRHWPSTRKAGTVSQVQRQLLTLTALTLTQKHTVSSGFLSHCFTCVGVWERACKSEKKKERMCNQVRFQPWRTR